MLVAEPFRYEITDFDREVFRRFVPWNHPLLAAERAVDWERLRPAVESFYSLDRGQPAIDPVRMLELEFLRYWKNLSDQQVMERTKTDVAFRCFLQVGHTFRPPDPSSLSYFRGRLGGKGFSEIFDGLVGQMREAGIVKDRLRLKDASHVVANIAVPTTLTLVAQIRDRLLGAVEPLDASWVAGQRIEVNLLRERTQDAVDLVLAEQAAHGNQIEGLSIDGAGFNGQMLRELEGVAAEDTATEAPTPDGNPGMGMTVYVPPKAEPSSNRFTPANFTSNADGTAVTCPAGQTSRYHQRDTGRHAEIFRFTRSTCEACPLRGQCVAKLGTGPFGRSVTKNDYEAEYERARQRAKSDEFAAVRREHPAVERKLNELMNHHGGRRARYWGRAKVRVQQLMTGFVVNTKRFLCLLATLRADPTAIPARGN